jgi:hypothetical protein
VVLLVVELPVAAAGREQLGVSPAPTLGTPGKSDILPFFGFVTLEWCSARQVFAPSTPDERSPQPLLDEIAVERQTELRVLQGRSSGYRQA